jgi:hypothetical protein
MRREVAITEPNDKSANHPEREPVLPDGIAAHSTTSTVVRIRASRLQQHCSTDNPPPTRSPGYLRRRSTYARRTPSR